MKGNILNVFYIFISLLVSVPVMLHAQNGRDGNHCAVVKSPYRLSMDSGKIVYSRACVSCHQADGKGIAGTCPSLHGKFITGDKKKLIQILVVEHASAEEAKEDSSRYTAPKNPEMSDTEIANVLTYIRNNFGNKSSAVKFSEVKSFRSQ